MKKKTFVGLVSIVSLCFIMIACLDGWGNGEINGGSNSESNNDLKKYQEVGASVAAKTWVEDEYDCSNFTVQFYQDCYKIGLPCRVRNGNSGGSRFEVERHAWNSVLIEGQWVDWEPQINNVYNGHTQTSTSAGLSWGTYTWEELTRIFYELIGRNVPKNIIDAYEIDKYTYHNSPFNNYFGGLCIGEDITLPAFTLPYIQSQLPNNGDGSFYITFSNMLVHWFYKMDGKHYVVVNLRSLDHAAGRSIIQNNANVDFSEDGAFFRLDPSIWPKL